MGSEVSGGRRADDYDNGNETGGGFARQCGVARSFGHGSQHDICTVAGHDSARRLGQLLQAQTVAERCGHECRSAEIHAGSRSADAAGFAGGLESVSEVAIAEFSGEFAIGPVRRGRFRIQRQIPCGHQRDEAALEALRGIQRSTSGGSAGKKICGEIFSA